MHSLLGTWKGLSLVQRVTLGAVVAGVFGGILLVASLVGRPSYGVLFSNLEPDDAGAVTGKLRELKVDYRLTQAGRAVEVPEEQVYDLRNTLASDGLPRGGSVGFEIFDKANFGATDFTQRLNYQRALQGELTRTIGRLEGVLDSRVHIAIPEKRLFIDQDEPTTASVVLRLRPGYRMGERQVGGIVHLVSAAVERLKPENVSVLDDHGTPLSTSSASSPQLTDSQIQLQERYEERVAAELQRLADQVLGPGKAAIRVSADLNWDQTDTTTETYKPAATTGKGLVTQETSNRESYTKLGGAAGAPGVTVGRRGAELIPDDVADRTRPGEYVRNSTEGQFAVNKVVEHRVTAPGKLRRLSVAVLLDANISPAQQLALKDAFSAGAGLDPTPVSANGRGDRIELVPMAFDRTAEKEAARAAESAAKSEQRAELVRNGAAVTIVVLVLAASLVMFRRGRSAPSEGLDVLLSDAPPPGLPRAPELGAAGMLDDAAEQAQLAPLERTRRLAADRPEEVARQIQAWMAD